MDERQYVERAKARVRELVDHELAVVVLELEARISEAGFAGSGLNIDPHHVTTALRELIDEDELVRDSGTTRGGSHVTTVQPRDQRTQAPELYQLLSKAVTLQQTHPNQPIVPVFVCRKAHETTFWMARQLGFMVIDMGAQFVGDVEEAHLNEVRSELHFLDLHSGIGPSRRVRDRFRDTLPAHCVNIAANWQHTALDPSLAGMIFHLKTARTSDRGPLMNELRSRVKATGLRGGW
jgi:hypothetical protein